MQQSSRAMNSTSSIYTTKVRGCYHKPQKSDRPVATQIDSNQGDWK